MSDRPFARVYYVDLQRDYPGIYRDNEALSTYVRMLSLADATWPVTPDVPRSEKAIHVKKLVDASLVTLIPPYGFAIKGFDAERNARSNAASNAARTRWGNAAGSAERNANTSPVQPSPLRAQSAPKMNGHLIDPQKQTPEEYRRALEAAARRQRLPVEPA